jgi:hypothetical protein
MIEMSKMDGVLIELYSVSMYWVEVLYDLNGEVFTHGGMAYEYPCHVVFEFGDTNHPEAYKSMKHFKQEMGKGYCKVTKIGYL